MAGEWIWRAFGGSNETVKKGLFLTVQAMAAGMVWFYGRCGKAGNAKNRRRSAQSRGKSDGDEFETPVSSPGKSAKSAKRATPFKTPLQTPVKASVKTPIKNAVKTPVKSAVKSVVSSLLLTPVASLSASLSGCKGSDWKQEGPVRRLFQNEDEYILPEYRAQRGINEARIPEIRDYILNNKNTYVFSALSASIDGTFEFHPSEIDDNVGILEVDMGAVLLINDGQHRKAAIEAALIEAPELAKETISIVLFKDEGLKRSQQMFADLNKHAVKSTMSLSTLYDYRDDLANAVKEVVFQIPFLNKYIDKEKSITLNRWNVAQLVRAPP